jgi:NhaP-type Na+/H+ or K+/H+ antiporter
MLALHETQLGIVWAVGSLVIFSSLIVHGLSATPFTMLYGKVAQRSEHQQQETLGSGSGMQQGHKPAVEHH